MPGVSSAVFSQDSELFWGGDESRIEVLRVDGIVDSSAEDAGSSPTSVLRKGLLLGKMTASGKLKEWDLASTDGSETLHSVLPVELTTIDRVSLLVVDRFGPVVVKAPLRASRLLYKGTALVGSAAEYAARVALAKFGCRLDDDPQGLLAGPATRDATVTATGAITASQSGTVFSCAGAAARTLTLPTLIPGLHYRFINTVGQNLTIASAEGDNIAGLNDLSMDSITFSTANQLIGATLDIYSGYVAGTLKWIPDCFAATATTAT